MIITKLFYFDLSGENLPKNFKIKKFSAKITSLSGGSGSGGRGSGSGSDSKIAASTSLHNRSAIEPIFSIVLVLSGLNISFSLHDIEMEFHT